MGPCIVVGDLDHRNVNVETRINGEVRQSYNTKEMIWSFGEVLEYLSRDFSFVPGDVIAGGTSAGTAADMSRRQTEGAAVAESFSQNRRRSGSLVAADRQAEQSYRCGVMN